jgi:hypothetical protein
MIVGNRTERQRERNGVGKRPLQSRKKGCREIRGVQVSEERKSTRTLQEEKEEKENRRKDIMQTNQNPKIPEKRRTKENGKKKRN